MKYFCILHVWELVVLDCIVNDRPIFVTCHGKPIALVGELRGAEMAARIKKVQIQARRSGRTQESDWYAAFPFLFLEIDGSRFLSQNANNMVFEYRSVPASKQLPGVVPFN